MAITPLKNIVTDSDRTKATRVNPGLPVWLLLIITFLTAFALRIFRLDGQSLWSDEGASVIMTTRSVTGIIEAAAGDIHPPLYYILLSWWAAPTGITEFALRFLSLAFGLVFVATIYKIGERLFSKWVGGFAAFLAATAPFLVYYSQEARMYMQLGMFGALSAYFFLRLVADDRNRPWYIWAAFILTTAACLYSQYFGISIIIFENLAFLLYRFRFWRHLRLWLAWGISQAAVGLLFLPWYLLAMRQLNTWPGISEPFTIQTLLYRVFLVFSFGLSWDMTTTEKTQLMLGLLLASCLIWLVIPKRFTHRGLLPRLWAMTFTLLFFLVPVLVMYVLSLSRPMYNPKFLIVATPGFFLFLGAGIEGLRQLLALPFAWMGQRTGKLLVATVSIVVVVATLAGVQFATQRSLAAYYFDPKYGRDDYRGLVERIQLMAKPGDAIVLNAPGQSEIFGYYYKGDIPIYPLPKQRPIDEKATERDLQELAAKHQRIWVVLWAVVESDPNQVIERWLDQNTFKAPDRWFGNVRLALYGVPSGEPPQMQKALGANLSNKITLLGYNLRGVEGTVQDGGPDAVAGDMLQLTLFWKNKEKVNERYKVFTHLLDDDELIWGQRDAEPGGGAKITTIWKPGEEIVDNYGLPVALGTPPGTYNVQVGMYDMVTGKRLHVLNEQGYATADRVLFGPVKIGKPYRPPVPSSLYVEHPLSVDFGDVRLIGYDFYKLGYDRGNVDFHPGEQGHLTLYWEAKQKPGKDYKVSVQVLDKNGTTIAGKENPPAGGRYGFKLWEAGDIYRDQYKFPLSNEVGQFNLTVGLKDGENFMKPGGGKVVSGSLVELEQVLVK